VNVAIIAAGGVGERLGEAGGKQLATVAGLPVLAHVVLAFESCDAVDAIIVVTHPERVDEYRRAAVEAVHARKVVSVVGGGDTRGESVRAGLQVLPAGARLVAVHDGARAAVLPDTIAAAFAALAAAPDADGVVIGHPSYDTIKRVDAEGLVIATPDRGGMWVAQTPQVFRREALERAYGRAREEAFEGTDDSALVERYGGRVRMLAGPRWNLKVTVPEDLEVLGALLASRERSEGR
jgi:2-C-methyl-D-erythritol 4-phosphate cytidylyltransferase